MDKNRRFAKFNARLKLAAKAALAVICVSSVAMLTFTEEPPDVIDAAYRSIASYSGKFDADALISVMFGVSAAGDEKETESREIKYIGYGAPLDELLSEDEPPLPEPQTLADGCYPIREENISMQSETKKLLFKNSTSKKINDAYVKKLLSGDYPVEAGDTSEGPLVLIVHTHTTECYAKEGQTSYMPANAVAETRSRNDAENVIAVGDAIEEVLRSMGIGVVHCRDYHDVYKFNESYNHSYASVKKYLAEYPTIKYVIDVHRDSVIHTNKTKVCPVTEINGKKAAQVMLVIGTNDNGLKHDGWEKNLTLAVKLENRLLEKYGDLVRPLNIRSGRFNQQLCEGMLLFEIGSCGNTLEQAKYSAKLVAYEYGGMIIENIKK